MDLPYRQTACTDQPVFYLKFNTIALFALLGAIMCSPSHLAAAPENTEASPTAADADAAHAALLLREQYPSATACANCHPKHYKEWSISQHSYAQMSPVFNAMQGTVIFATNGTNGDFCIRCHNPVGMNLKEKEFMSNIDRHPTSREGVTCIACHRLTQPYGKVSGRLSVERGDITQAIYGPRGDAANLKAAIEGGGLITDNDKAGRKVHDELKPFTQLSKSAFCATCHDVNLVNGFRLEEAFSEYKNSPASANGVTCQDCHMGKEPGATLADRSDPDFEKKNYDFGPAAVVGKIKFESRKLTNHMFVGPDYSVLSPELFPLHPQAIREESEIDDPTVDGHATIRQWVEFREYLKDHPEHEESWGLNEDAISIEDEEKLPLPFGTYDDREVARQIVDENVELLKYAEEQRLKLLKNGYKLGEIVVEKASSDGIRFKVQVSSGTDGHNVPTGFDGERLVWLSVQVLDGSGKVIHESGDLDPNGDVRDLHSAYVHNHELPQDKELFSLQSKFLTRNARGGEREQVLPLNWSATPLIYVRPERRSSVLLGRPGGARKHKIGIEPLGERWATYNVKKDKLEGNAGPYKAVVQLRAAMIPVNLVNAIKGVGFDYNMSARDISEKLIEGHQLVWEREVALDGKFW